jgi:hypothetical protein
LVGTRRGQPFGVRVARTNGRARGPAISIGGAERDRTVDLLTASQALSQLSYSPTSDRSALAAADSTALYSTPTRARKASGGADALCA